MCALCSMIVFAFLALAAAALQCRWACDDPQCEAECTLACEKPVCESQCEGEAVCQVPRCSIRCSAEQPSAADACPACETICEPPVCTPASASCQNFCQATVCGWSCQHPKICPKPRCELACERPACEAVPAGASGRAPLLALSASIAFALSQ